jgi:hypothetical protein
LLQQAMTTAISRSARARRAGAAALCAALALVAALASVRHVSLLPPGLHGPRHLQIATASTHVVVDRARSPIADTRAETGDFDSLARRSVLLGELMTSRRVLEYVGRRAGVPAEQIAGFSPVTSDVPAVFKEPDSERRADEIARSTAPYRLNVQSSPALPTLDVYAQAPTPAAARRMASAAVAGLRDYLRAVAAEHGADPEAQVRLVELGAPRGGVVNGGAAPEIAVFTFLVVFAISSGLLAIVVRARRGWLAAAAAERDVGRTGAPAPSAPPPATGPPGAGPPADVRRPRWRPGPRAASGVLAAVVPLPTAPGAVALPELRAHPVAARAASRRFRLPAGGGDWPHTTRLLPWLLAAFMAVVWLVPFNTIQLSASLPVDLKFDRLILPFIVGLWVLALAAGGRGAPRVRLTAIHVALALFVALACLSLVLDARYLNQTLELDRGIKKLTLLLSYLSLFVMLASVVRRSEVRPFLTYTLILACLCALGTVWEYRFHYNAFYTWSAQLLPGIFDVGTAEPTGVDEIGRRLVRGPGEVPLEAVAMFTMALPIALVGVLRSARARERILYGLAACLLLAAAVSTYRKSAFLAPIAVILTLACFERRRLLRLAPLGVVGLAAIHALSPGALGSIAVQLHSNRLGVATISDRASDYDAVRPDVWSHLAFGRGFGTYDHTSYRILDMELLHSLVVGGVLGLLAYVAIAVAVIAVARRVIASRDGDAATAALVAAAAAIGFLAVSTLFDVMSFPHCPYIFLFLAGFLAVVARAPERSWRS